MKLSCGQRVTLLKIDDMLAMTHRIEVEVRKPLTRPGEKDVYVDLDACTTGSRRRVAVVRHRGKRKEVYLDLASDDILLDGWDQPFRADGECAGGVMNGNACYNLVGDPDTIRQAVEMTAVYPVSDEAKAKILVSPKPQTTQDDSGTIMLYPDIETHHAVINRMKEARADAAK